MHVVSRKFERAALFLRWMILYSLYFHPGTLRSSTIYSCWIIWIDGTLVPFPWNFIKLQNLKYGFCLTREHTEVGIADFDEIWREYSFRKNIRPVPFFLSAMVDVEGVKTQSWWRETYFVKYLGNYWRYRFCVNWWNLYFLTTNAMVYTVLQRNLLFKQYT